MGVTGPGAAVPPEGPVPVTVVVPHYEAPRSLALVLAALELQDHPLHLLDVVVADDGSRNPPHPGPRPYRVRVVGQADEGFRAAAARNLGAAGATGDVLCFLDADTVPEPGYVSAVVRAVTAGADLVVGRRRHADLAAVDADRLRRWMAGALGASEAPAELPEPAWLREAYDRTDDLRAAGDDAYRFVISAVLSVRRSLFEAVGGFEEAFRAYGGEDWELAHRCWLAGADLVHAPDAVAWHDGPDFAGRTQDDDARRSRNAEGLALARFVPGVATRGDRALGGLVWEHPDVVVRLDDTGAEVADVVAGVRSLLAGTDAGVWLVGGEAASALDDPRVHAGEPPPAVLRRCRFQVELDRPVALAGVTLAELAEVAPVRVGEHLVVRRTRDVSRAARGVGVGLGVGLAVGGGVGGGGGAAEPAVARCDLPGVSATVASGADLQRAWGAEDHRRVPRLQRSLRTPAIVSERPRASP